jgi:hypothetical protein
MFWPAGFPERPRHSNDSLATPQSSLPGFDPAIHVAATVANRMTAEI